MPPPPESDPLHSSTGETGGVSECSTTCRSGPPSYTGTGEVSTCEDPDRRRRLADYSDKLFKSNDGEMNCYYICMAHDPPCCSLIESKAWDRLHETDLAAKGQRFYCPSCKARYKPKSGVLVELILKGKAMYCRADLPPEHMKDAKYMMIQVNPPEDLFAALHEISPLDQQKVYHTPSM